jgi:hypothetical protein
MLPFFIALHRLGLLRVNELEELVGLDATYSVPSPAHFDEESSNNEALRLAAYKQRFEEEKAKRVQIRSGDEPERYTERVLLRQQCKTCHRSAFDTAKMMVQWCSGIGPFPKNQRHSILQTPQWS